MISKVTQHRPHSVVVQGSDKSSGIKPSRISWAGDIHGCGRKPDFSLVVLRLKPNQ